LATISLAFHRQICLEKTQNPFHSSLEGFNTQRILPLRESLQFFALNEREMVFTKMPNGVQLPAIHLQRYASAS
jgi:hypothetical protein